MLTLTIRTGKQAGFALIELMLTLAIIGVLSSLALPAYQSYTLKAKMVEAVLLIDRLNKDVEINFTTTGELPARVMGAASKESVVMTDSALIRDFRYNNTSNKKFTRGWIRVRFMNNVIPGCTNNKCGIYTGFIIRDGRLDFHCGHWNKGWGSFPLELMPQHCRETSVAVAYAK